MFSSLMRKHDRSVPRFPRYSVNTKSEPMNQANTATCGGCFAACAKKFTKAGLEATFKSLGCTDDQKAAYTTVLKENGVDVDSTGKPVYDTNTKKTRTTQLRINDGNSTTLDDKEEDDSDMLSDELNAGKRAELAAMVLLVVMTGVAAVTY